MKHSHSNPPLTCIKYHTWHCMHFNILQHITSNCHALLRTATRCHTPVKYYTYIREDMHTYVPNRRTDQHVHIHACLHRHLVGVHVHAQTMHKQRRCTNDEQTRRCICMHTFSRGRCTPTRWRRYTRCLQLQVVFCQESANYRALVRKLTGKDKVSYGSSLPCTHICMHTLPCGSHSI